MNSMNLYRSQKILNSRRVFYKRDIKSTISKDGERIIFFPKNGKLTTNYKDNVVRECNGLLIRITNNDIKPLVIPPRLLSPIIDYDFVNSHIELYEIYTIKDGTTVNIYWYEPLNEWRYSTGRGYDVTELSWNNQTNYRDVFHSLLTDKFNLDSQEFYNSLDKNKCYTWGFNHPSYHLFWATGDIWFIQSTDLNTFKIDLNSPIPQIKIQETIDIINPVNSDKIDLRHIRVECDSALDKYIQCRSNRLLGYILRSKDTSITNEYSDIIIESSLFKKIRVLCYDRHYREYSVANGYDREKYMVLYNYVDNYINRIFLLLFPQYTEKFAHINKCIENIIRDVIEVYQKRRINYFKSSTVNTTKINDEIIDSFIKFIDNNLVVHIEDQSHEEYIRQVVKSRHMIDKLYNIIYKR
jgi:hypothetical protein